MYPNGQPGSGWDSSDAPNSWYGAGAISMSGSTNRVTVGAISATLVVPSDPVMAVDTGKDQTSGTHSMVRFVPLTFENYKRKTNSTGSTNCTTSSYL